MTLIPEKHSTVSDGDEALDFAYRRGEYEDAPQRDLILLDWKLPGTSGEEVLMELNDDPDLAHIPVIVLTGSQAEKDVVTAYTNNANACISKASDPDEYLDTIRVFEEFWLSVAELPDPDKRKSSRHRRR